MVTCVFFKFPIDICFILAAIIGFNVRAFTLQSRRSIARLYIILFGARTVHQEIISTLPVVITLAFKMLTLG